MRPALPCRAALFAALLALPACADFPEIEAPGLEAAERAAYPELLPLTRILHRADAPVRFTEAEAEALLARARGLGRLSGRAPASARAAGDAQLLRARAEALTAAPDTAAAAAAERLARLRARAEILRGPLAGEADVERMRQALALLRR
jgi:hypothetical protein